MRLPPLETARLRIRELELVDLTAVHRVLDVDLADALGRADPSEALESRRRWLEWTVASYAQLANLHQPPYGDRAIVLRESDELIGVCGYVPCLGPFGTSARYIPEVGLYWAIAPAHRGRGYATEAGAGYVDAEGHHTFTLNYQLD